MMGNKDCYISVDHVVFNNTEFKGYDLATCWVCVKNKATAVSFSTGNKFASLFLSDRTYFNLSVTRV